MTVRSYFLLLVTLAFQFGSEALSAQTIYSAGKVYNISRVRGQFPGDLSAFTCRSDVPSTPNTFAPPRNNPDTSIDETAVYLATIRDFEYRLSTITAAYLRSATLSSKVANCALDWLDNWAAKDFMVKEPNISKDSTDWWHLQYERAFLGASIAQHFAAIADEPGLSVGKRARVADWLEAVALKTYDFSYYREREAPETAHNNIFGWMGLHMVATGVVVGNNTLTKRGVYAFKKTMAQIRPDGLMTEELKRVSEGKSFWYHNYALRPLFMTASIMVHHQMDLFSYENADGATIVDAGRRVIKEMNSNMATFPNANKQGSISNPSYFLTDNTGQLDWMEIYNSKYYKQNSGEMAASLLIKARRAERSSDVAGGLLKTKCGPNGTIGRGRRSP